ncbi:hypothetical protein HZZ13_08180 [Bradyrhizobium sp. CNPSo 4010]|uniref:Uncharacterized protein n=1 Tax=Bradyrhizobium agreste TaxID=2751811 RepID=A0ABS0PLJ4_9BRAD|nr:hypothetical protein [Bradyrhizobium agreste]MBH5397772.1 hypothetical protein [Bradyrhizobium agreste]
MNQQDEGCEVGSCSARENGARCAARSARFQAPTIIEEMENGQTLLLELVDSNLLA